MTLAITLNELLSDPIFVICAPIGILVVVIILVLLGKGDIDL